MRRIGIFTLMLVVLAAAIVSMASPAAAQGYPYSGRLTGYALDCVTSRVVGSVLDENGNHVTEPVMIRLWKEDDRIAYYQMSGTSPSDLTGPSGFNFNIQVDMSPWHKAWDFGTFYVTVVEPDPRSQEIDEGWLAEPVKFQTLPECLPDSQTGSHNVAIVEFRLGGQPAPAPGPAPAPLPSGTNGDVVPVAADATCRAFTETAGDSGQFRVCDDNQARFLSAFNRYGLQNIGYPISQRYEHDGFVTQAFQKAILQWRGDTDSVAFVNIFDDLHNAGFDQRLKEVRQVPDQLPAGWDGTADFPQIQMNRQALLDERPALSRAYFAASDPVTFFGLPTSDVTDMGNHYAVRTQRAVLQEWKEDVPWARAGQVTIANGGDIAKEMGALPAAALAPEALP